MTIDEWKIYFDSYEFEERFERVSNMVRENDIDGLVAFLQQEDLVPWSSGYDDALSRRKRGFNSPWDRFVPEVLLVRTTAFQAVRLSSSLSRDFIDTAP